VGPGAILTSCEVGDEVQIGAGCVVQEGCIIGKRAVIAAGAVLAEGTFVPAEQFWAGNPAVFVRTVEEDEYLQFEKRAVKLAELSQEHEDEFLPFGYAHTEAEK